MDLLVEMMRGACSRKRVELLADCKREALRVFDKMLERRRTGGTFHASC